MFSESNAACLSCCRRIPLGWYFCSPHCQQEFARATELRKVEPKLRVQASDPEQRRCQCGVLFQGPQPACSKRCSWHGEQKCPQCGRPRPFDQAYCSVACASQGAQANWCGSCGLKQILPGLTHCSASCASKGSDNLPVRPRRKVFMQDAHLVHELLSATERARNSFGQALNNIVAAHGLTLINVAKIAHQSVRRRSYLTYRAAVELQMATNRCAKYGHGGEGNEQKRYIPLAIRCTLGEGGNPFATQGSNAAVCNDPSCECCQLLQNGFSLSISQRPSHYATASLQAALQWCTAGDSGLTAIALCRAVVGVPDIVSCSTDVKIVSGCHSSIVTDGNIENDGTYLFRDDAIEAQYLMVFR